MMTPAEYARMLAAAAPPLSDKAVAEVGRIIAADARECMERERGNAA